MNVGVVGLGAMGGGIAAALARAAARGDEVLVHDPSAEATGRAVAAGCRSVESLGDLAADADRVILSLPSDAVVADVLDGLLESAQARESLRLVVDTSTISPDAARRNAARCAEAGVVYVDAPVLGRPAALGRWTVPLGRAVDDLGVAELLAPVAARVVPVGDVGAAATLKVVNNQMLAVINAVTAEALAVAEAAGLDPAVFVDTVIESGAASVSGLFSDVAPRAVRRDFAPVFSVALMEKDNALAVGLADQVGVSVPVSQAALALHRQALDAGLGEQDSIAVLDAIGRTGGAAG